MADRSQQQRELVFCHACENEWHRDQHGLECPRCHSDAVEIIEAHNDPRDNHIDLTENDDEDDDEMPSLNGDALPHHPLHHHNPWAHDAPDPDEGDIEHVAFSPAPGIHFEHTTIRSTSPFNRQGQTPNDAFAPLFQSFAGMFNGPRPGQPPPDQRPHVHHFPGPGAFNRDQPDSPHFTTRTAFFPAGAAGDPNMNQPLNNIHAIMQTMLASIQANAVPPNTNDPHAQNRGQAEHNPFDFIRQALVQMNNPANAAHGDAVFTDEAMDRIVSQMMEANGESHAPGPASAAAIAALPKKQADKEMVGTDGKAECSVCMEAVLLGDTVTVLPCKHWFHGECVGAWLQEHDTCPHCRQGIMPKDTPTPTPTSSHPEGQTRRPSRGTQRMNISPLLPMMMNPNTTNQAQPQSPSQANQPPPPSRFGFPFTQPGMQQPYVPGGYQQYPEPGNYVQPSPPAPGSPTETGRPRSSARGSVNSEGREGSSSTSPGAASRVSGWFRNLRGGSGSGSSSGDQR